MKLCSSSKSICSSTPICKQLTQPVNWSNPNEMASTHPSVFVSNLLENGEWAIKHRPARKLINSRYSPDDLEYQEISFNLVIQRKPLFYIINIILPCSLISSLVVLAYFLPAQGRLQHCC